MLTAHCKVLIAVLQLDAGKELLNDAFLLHEAGFTPDQCVVNVTGGQSNNQYTAPNPAVLAAQEAASPALLLAREVSTPLSCSHHSAEAKLAAH